MKALYELLAKVGTNPKLRAWAMEQIINLKKLKPGYKKGWDYKDDLKKVKDIKNPNWLQEQIAKEKSYDLKNKVVDIGKAKEKVRWDKVDKQRDKDKFYGVTGQAETFLKKMGKDTDEFFKKHELDQKWLNKMIKAKKAGDPRAKKILDDYFKKQDKDFADKIIPFKPKKAEGGIITVSDPGMGDGPFMMEEFLEAVKKGFKGTYDEYIDQIDRSPRDYLAEGGSTQKDIDKGLKAIEKLKSSLMPESYEELIEIYKDKQKDLNIDIMESAGGLGEMLGEGGRTGMAAGGFAGWLAKQGPKVWKWVNKPGNNPYDLYKKYLKSVKTRAQAGDMKSLAPEMGALTAGGITANRWARRKIKEMDDRDEEADGGRVGMMYGGDPGFAFSYGGSWADWKDNHASEMPLMDYINQKLPKARNPFSDSSYQDGGPVIDKDKYDKALRAGKSPAEAYKEAIKDPLEALDLKAQFDEIFKKAEGGRIGLGSGTSPKIIENRKRNLFFDLGRDNFMNMFEYLQSGLSQNDYDGKYKKGGRVGFKKGGKGGIGDLMSELYRLFSISPLLGSPELTDLIQKIPFEKGGRAGFMSQTGIPYYADKALEGIVNSAETLSKLPFAAGKLGSQLLQSPPDKKMFTDALENITPGSWSKNLGISSLAEAEGAKVSDKQRAIGDVLGLGTEIAVPVGGAFKIGQKIIDQASKAMGKLKKGKTLDQTINDTITNFGQSRRDFNATVAASGLMVALKGIGLGSLLKGSSKKAEDIRVTYKTGINEPYEWDDVATWAGNYEFESLTAKGVNILKKVFGKDVRTVKDPSGELTAYVDNVDLGEATSWVNDVKKAGGKMELEHVDDYGSIEPVYQSINKKGVELTDKQKFLNVSSIDSGYGLYDDSIDEVYDIIYDTSKVKKAEGGFVGYPPVQLNPKEQPPIQGPLYETNNPNEAFKEILRRNIGSGIAGAPIGGNFDLGVGYGENKPFDYGIGYNMGKGYSGLYADYGIRDDGENMYTGGYKGDNFDVGVRKEEGGDPTFGFKFKKKFAKGGKAWQPKSAPQLTTTIPPESGPMPQGLTYLTGDDIVQNIGHKHGRN